MATTKLSQPKKTATGIQTVPATAKVKAFVVGIENYHPFPTGRLSKVEYAHADAEGFMQVLRDLYGDQLEDGDAELYLDSSATVTSLQYALKGFIASLGKDDLFIFYYAGHGFHGHGGNRITAWDSNAHNIEGTTLLLRDVLLDPLQASECRRALAFVDACASKFAPLVQGRDVVSNFDPGELKGYLTATEYFALYLSCSPQEKSYPSKKLGHGIWTHFLIQAMSGEAETAIGPQRYLTDQGLKDYLRTSVRDFMTKETTHRDVQTPQAFITASGTFAICEIPEATTPVSEAGDLSEVSVTPTEEYFLGIEDDAIKSLPGYNKRFHFVPDSHSAAVESFIDNHLTDTIKEQMQELYDQVKSNLNLRSKAVQQETQGGSGSIETEFFRFTIESKQHPTEASQYRIVRKLVIRGAADTERISQIDQTFSGLFDEAVVKTSKDFIVFEDLVDKLEDMQEAGHGTVRVEPAEDRATFTANDGSSVKFLVSRGFIHFSARGARSVLQLMDATSKYQLTLSGPSTLLLR